jgi:hypothetical protein
MQRRAGEDRKNVRKETYNERQLRNLVPSQPN